MSVQCGQPLPTDLCAVLNACAVLANMVAWCDSDMPSDSDMDFDDDAGSADHQSTYTGMSREDISTWLREAFGGNFSSSRRDEWDSICHMVYGHGELQPQEACLQMIHNSIKIFTNSQQSLVRSLVCLLWPCGSCGGSGHSADHCPANNSAAAAMLYHEQAEEPAGSASTKATAGKRAKQRAKQATKRAEAEKATTATNGGSSVADDEPGEAAATSVAANDAASVVDSADGGTTNASRDTERPQQKATAESVPVPAAASSVVNSANSGTAAAGKDTQQAERKDSAKRSSGADGKKTGDTDGDQVRVLF
jgi:hypothetical protein